MLNSYFIKQGIKEAEIESFIRKEFPVGDYSRIDLQRTPLGTKIVIYTNKPGKIIGRGGKNINDITEAVKKNFNLENPQIDVKMVDNPNLDASIVAKQISSALEKGYNFKKIGNLTLKRIMSAGAIGAEIIISGRISGGKGMKGRFIEGYLKRSGDTAKKLVDYALEEANTKPGKIGIKVRIMKEFIDITGERRKTFEKPKDAVKVEAELIEEKEKEIKKIESAKKETKKTKPKTKRKKVKKPSDKK
ncbi:MAG: 30S ribosomal protein S3 [Nanoarchaeota archaeon]|nr:30S ribosomal protein S3 [Nanoarchaeota archaeon]MBU1135267.1 30S ribosomal protein S3 [Nanoarchaeota archaeon]MBU2519883.1 30S ribosomal protein S3 [Nanoarchaeota archaeon]